MIALPLCLLVPIALGHKELLGSWITVQAPGVATMDQPLVVHIVPAFHTVHCTLYCTLHCTSRPGCPPGYGSCIASLGLPWAHWWPHPSTPAKEKLLCTLPYCFLHCFAHYILFFSLLSTQSKQLFSHLILLYTVNTANHAEHSFAISDFFFKLNCTAHRIVH